MKLLHILRSKPDELVRRLVDAMSRGESAKEVALQAERVDYDQLVRDVFEADKVICWW